MEIAFEDNATVVAPYLWTLLAIKKIAISRLNTLFFYSMASYFDTVHRR